MGTMQMLNVVKVILAVFCFASYAFATDWQLFHENPSQKKLLEAIREFDRGHDTDKELLINFLTRALAQYPKFGTKVIFKGYSIKTQESIAQAIANNGWNEMLPPLYKKLKNHKASLAEDYESNPKFKYANGDATCIKKILQFASSFPNEIKEISHTLKDQTPESYSHIKDSYVADKLNEIISYKTVSASIDSNKKRYKDIDLKVQQLIAEDPSLQY